MSDYHRTKRRGSCSSYPKIAVVLLAAGYVLLSWHLQGRLASVGTLDWRSGSGVKSSGISRSDTGDGGIGGGVPRQLTEAERNRLDEELADDPCSSWFPANATAAAGEADAPLVELINRLPPNPPAAGVRSFGSGRHDPTRRRFCLAFTAVPHEIDDLVDKVRALLSSFRRDYLHCIHVSIPCRTLRFQKPERRRKGRKASASSYPSTSELLHRLGGDDPRVVLHRLPADYGPLTRYVGPAAYELHPETSVIVTDVADGSDFRNAALRESVPIRASDPARDASLLVRAGTDVDKDAVWCFQGENFLLKKKKRGGRGGGRREYVADVYDTFPLKVTDGYEWNLAHFCRGAQGILLKPAKHMRDFWYNQSQYHESCFWDDDRWFGFQMERMGFPMKVVHPPPPEKVSSDGGRQRRRLGSLMKKNHELNSMQTCTMAWMERHPGAFPTAREEGYNKIRGRSAHKAVQGNGRSFPSLDHRNVSLQGVS